MNHSRTNTIHSDILKTMLGSHGTRRLYDWLFDWCKLMRNWPLTRISKRKEGEVEGSHYNPTKMPVRETRMRSVEEEK